MVNEPVEEEPIEEEPVEEGAIELVEKRYPRNMDMRIEYRREFAYFLWLKGKSLREIGDILGVSESTIWLDLKSIRAVLNLQPRSMEQIRHETLLSMRLIHADILTTIEEAKEVKNAKGQPAVRYDHLAKLYDVAASLDEKILERYTLPGTSPEVTAKADEQILAMIDYLEAKLGPEALTDFQEWWKARMDVKKKVQTPVV